MKKTGIIYILLLFAFVANTQPSDCILKPSQYTIHFGRGNVSDPNNNFYSYRRVPGSCPTDGHYSFASSTGGCFRDDWHTLSEDHTAGDVNGNMLLVNAAYEGGAFLSMPVTGLKPNTIYELGLWVVNLCKPTKKCPLLLLPSLRIQLVTSEGKSIATIVTRELPRIPEPNWAQHVAYFTTPASTSTCWLVMSDNAPGGCGNDFALDDITFRECVKKITPPKTSPKKLPSPQKKIASNRPQKKIKTPFQKKVTTERVTRPKSDTVVKTSSVVKPTAQLFPAPPLVLKTRENALVKKIETDAGEIKINIYDNAEIDDDTVSIYHNNILIKSKQRLSQKPISISIPVNASQPHHELIMVAENLGSIPPNTSVMIISTPGKRYSVFISSSEQKNAKVVFDLKQ